MNTTRYRKNVGLIIINDQGKVLLCRRKKSNSWQFPQGGIDQGETPKRAAYRELYEEVNIKRNEIKFCKDCSAPMVCVEENLDNHAQDLLKRIKR